MKPRMSRYFWAKIIEHCNIHYKCRECMFYSNAEEHCGLKDVSEKIEEAYDKMPKKYKKTLKEAYSNNH